METIGLKVGSRNVSFNQLQIYGSLADGGNSIQLVNLVQFFQGRHLAKKAKTLFYFKMRPCTFVHNLEVDVTRLDVAIVTVAVAHPGRV